MRHVSVPALAFALTALAPAGAEAQCVLPDSPAATCTDAVCPTPDSRATGDVRIYARMTAASLRFATQPRADVQPLGCVTGDTVRVLTRTNIPEPVVAGETYRDVEIAVEIVTSLHVICLPALLDLLRTSTAAPRLAALCSSNSANRDNPGTP